MHEILLPRRRISRLYNSYRHPDQAAIAARLPILGRRVPARPFWRRQRIDPHRMLSHASAMLVGRSKGLRTQATQASGLARNELPAVRERAIRAGRAAIQEAQNRTPEARERAARLGERAAKGARSGARAGGGAARTLATRAPRGRLFRLVSLFTVGAMLMFYLDPQSGRRRRARVRDRLAHLRRVATRDLPRTAERRGRFVQGIVRGVRHDAAEILPHRHPIVDDETLVARVRSEVLRRADVPAGEIHVDAYEGRVTLRGQLEEEREIQRVLEGARHVEGVTEVRSYLHLPGTLPPNKAESLKAEVNGHMPAHLQR